MECDEICAERKEKQRCEAEAAEMRQRELEAERNRMELLDFEKKFGKKKYKERKRCQVEEKENNFGKILIAVSVAVILVSFGVYLIYFQ